MLEEQTIIRPQPGPQEAFLSTPADIAIYGGAAGGGKALKVDTPILTTAGWKQMGDLLVGDMVYGSNGMPINIIAIQKPFLSNSVYEMTFDSGVKIIADDKHLWHTFTEKEREAKYRRSYKFRKNRRSNRKSRGKGKRPDLSIRNAEQAKSYKPKPVNGSIRSTAEIVETLLSKRKALNHSIDVCESIDGGDWLLPIDPYIIGVWLGDGNTNSGAITIANNDMLEILKKIEPNIRHIPSQKYLYRIPELTKRLKDCDLLNNKHIPDWVLTSNRESRLAVLQGLMDSDGTVLKNGRLEFSVINENLARGFLSLAASLGLKASWNTGKSYYYDKYCGIRYRINFRSPFPVFRLNSKLNRQNLNVRTTTRRHYITDIKHTSPCMVCCISVDAENGIYLAGESLIPTHNSYALLLEPLRHIDNPNFGCVIFRRYTTEVLSEGGLWDESHRIYPYVGGIPRENRTDWTFPSGARISFRHMEHEKTRHQYQGAQIAMLGFDEVTEFTWQMFSFMMSRNRSTCGIRPYIRATCNPDPDSFVADMINWYLDKDTGIAIPERSGKIRWFVNINDAIHWGHTPEELETIHGEGCQPKSFTFIPSSIFDNKILLRNDPGYLANLKALSFVDQQRLLYGDWKIRPSAGNFFKREWFEVIDRNQLPVVRRRQRYWDRAATKPTSSNPDPDWSCGMLFSRAQQSGIMFVEDVFRMRDGPPQVQAAIKNLATQDGKDVTIWLEQDPGQAGKSEIDHLVKLLMGYNVRSNVVSRAKDIRAKPASAQAFAGNIKVVRAPWNDAFFAELENFPPPKDRGHDDQADCLSGNVNTMSEETTLDYNVLGAF